jgi:thymidylate synthase (FAD)
MALDPLGDSKSSVEMIASMGDDLMVVNAARVSFAKLSTQITEGDKKLIRYLARNNHITPFFHPQIQFRLKMPIFVAREWFRHTIGFSRNEVSRRYVDFKAETYNPEHLRARDKNLKQGSKEEDVENNEAVAAVMRDAHEASIAAYEKLLELNVAPEMARMALPQSMYTEFIETSSLYGYARLCKLRLDPHAQKEIQQYAEAIHKVLVERFPVSWAALMEPYVVSAAPVAAPVAAAPTPGQPAHSVTDRDAY